MNDEILIELVRKHSVLYDLSNPKYIDSQLKTRIWNDIGKELNVNGSTCKSRWNNIRDQYRKSLKKTTTTSGQSPKKIKLYKYYEQLSFLKHFFHQRETKGNISSLEEAEEGKNATDIVSNPDDREVRPNQEFEDSAYFVATPSSSSMTTLSPYSVSTLSPVSTPPPTPVPSAPTTSPAPLSLSAPPSSIIRSKKAKRNPPKTAAASLMEYVIKNNEVQNVQPQHPIDAFLVGIASTLKNLSPYYQNLAKSEVFATVQKYEMRMLTDNQQVSTPAATNTSMLQDGYLYSPNVTATVTTSTSTMQNSYLTTSITSANNNANASTSLLINEGLRDYVCNFSETQ